MTEDLHDAVAMRKSNYTDREARAERARENGHNARGNDGGVGGVCSLCEEEYDNQWAIHLQHDCPEWTNDG